MSYYDFDKLLDCSGIGEALYLQDLRQRKFYFNEDITADAAQDVIRHILQINREDEDVPPEKRKPILLYIMSDGGEVDAGFAMIDVIQQSVTPVYTINLGWQYSMGFLVGLAGHQRFATKNAKYLIHDGGGFLFNSSTKMQDQMEFFKTENQRIREYVLDRTHITPEEYDSNLRKEWYLYATEAKEKGICTHIVGIDCDLYEII